MARNKLMGLWRKLVVRKRNAAGVPAVNPGPWFMPLPSSLTMNVAIRTGSRTRGQATRLIWVSPEAIGESRAVLKTTLFNN